MTAPSSSASLSFALRSNMVMVASAPTSNISVVTSNSSGAGSSTSAVSALSTVPSSDVPTAATGDGASGSSAAPTTADTSATADDATTGGAQAADNPTTAAPIAAPPVADNAPAAASAPVSVPLNHFDEDDDDENDVLDMDVNMEYLQALMDMGFPEQRCLAAIAQTNSVEQATEFLLMNNAIDPPEGGDMDLSEDAQMLQAIAMSLATDTPPSQPAVTNEQGSAATASESEASTSTTTEAITTNTDSSVPVSSVQSSTSNMETTTTASSTPIRSNTLNSEGGSTTVSDSAVSISDSATASPSSGIVPSAGHSASTAAASSESSAGSRLVDITVHQRKPATYKSSFIYRIATPFTPAPKLNDIPLPKESLDDFTNNILDGCLRQLDCQGEIVYKVCDLLSTCSKRNGSTWLHGMLTKLVDEINSQGLMLKQIAVKAHSNIEITKELWASDLANKFAIRLHLITLLLEEVRDSCTQDIDCEGLITNLASLLCYTEEAMASAPRPVFTGAAYEAGE